MAVRNRSSTRGMLGGVACGCACSGPVARFPDGAAGTAGHLWAIGAAGAATGTAGRLWAIGADDTAAGSARRQPGPQCNTGDWADSGRTGAPPATATSGRYGNSSSGAGKAARIRRSDTAAADGASQECERRRGRHREPEPGQGVGLLLAGTRDRFGKATGAGSGAQLEAD